jgi:hypothetical protein
VNVDMVFGEVVVGEGGWMLNQRGMLIGGSRDVEGYDS